MPSLRSPADGWATASGCSTLLRIVLAWSLFTALSGAAMGFTSLLVYRLLFGIGEAGAFPNIARVQSRWFPRRLRAAPGGFCGCRRDGAGRSPSSCSDTCWRDLILPSFAVPSVMSPHFTSCNSLRPGDWVLVDGFTGIGLDGPLFLLVPRQSRREVIGQRHRVGVDPIRSRAGGIARRPWGSRVWSALFTSQNLWFLALAYLCISFGWSFFVSWMPRYLLDVHHVSFKGSQAMDVLPMFCGGISCLIGGTLSDALVRATGWTRFGRAIFPISGYLTAAVAMFAIRLSHTPGQAIFLMCIASAANDFGQGACWTTVIGIGGLYAGTAFGFMNMVGNIGNLQPVVAR